MTDMTGDTMGGAGSGVCEPTNHSRPGGRVLKETGSKTVKLLYDTTDLSKPVLIVTHNKM